MEAAFWTQVALQDMTPQQWESLCDGCGKCCLHKLEDEETDELCFTSVACRHLNLETCRCSVYDERLKHVPDCVTLRPDNLDELVYLPSTCAYRLIYEGQELPAWHPLLSGDQNSVHAAHVSVRGKVISEEQINEEDLDLYIIDKL
jgi:uncharacterized cysteine cluster protein YcgN (CxxCxxCC family)